MEPFTAMQNQPCFVCDKGRGETPIKGRKFVSWTTVWQFTLAALALLELWSCLYFYQGRHLTHLKATDWSKPGNVSRINLGLKCPPSHHARKRYCVIPKEEAYLSRKVAVTRDSEGTTWHSEAVSGRNTTYWMVFWNRIFMAALILHAVVDSLHKAHAIFCKKHPLQQKVVLWPVVETEEWDQKSSIRSRPRLAYLLTVVVFLGTMLLHLLSLPLLHHNMDPVCVATKRTVLSSLWGLFSRQKQAACHIMTSDKASTAATVSVAETIIRRILLHVDTVLTPKLKANIRAAKISCAARMALLAVRRPFHFRLRLKQVLAFFRWYKFLTPLLDAANRVRKHLEDFWDKWCMRQRQRRASRAWSFVAKRVMGQHRGDVAAKIMLKNYREKKRKQALKDPATASQREISACTKIQSRHRASLARHEIQRVKSRKQLFVLKGVWAVTSIQRREARALKREIRRRLRANRKLLFRPNTSFSVAWKLIVIACVLLEMLQSILVPRLSGKMEKASLEAQLYRKLFPEKDTPMITPECLAAPQFIPTLDNVASCAAAYGCLGISVLKQLCMGFVQLFLPKFLIVVNVIWFLNVFVIFFTGQLDKKTGVLVPKPFVQRWIAPGVALQLVSNPAMSGVFQLVKQLGHFASEVGASRLIHAYLALHPLLELAVDYMADVAFELAQKINSKVVTSFFVG